MNEKSSNFPQPLIDELLCIADTKWVLGHWYIKVMQNGRGLTDFNALSAMAQDQLGHTRALFSLLEQHGCFATNWLEFERSREQIHSMQLLDDPPESWFDFVITALLAELALQAAFDLGGEQRGGLGFLSRKCKEECDFHLLYLNGILQGLSAAGIEQAREQARASLAVRYPLALQWFRDGGSGADMRNTFIRDCEQQIARRLDMPLPASRDGADWDAARRRPQGAIMPATLWEFILPTNEQAVMCRRPLQVSNDDSIRFVASV